MDKILHVASTFKSHENDDGSVMIRGMASTNHSDRAGDVISAEAWAKGGLENFKNNPVILFNHDYDKPIGRATGVKITDNGLELEAKISKSAPAAVCELVKDGVLGAFSVGFKVKDADYIKETDGLMIKDAELFEVSVVSVPCNQAATFSLAKSFDSQDEYEEFKKTFTNRVDLPGQSLTKDDSKESNLVSDAPKHVEQSTNKETKMSEDNTPAIDLEAFAKKVADETAAKIAMKQAEQKAADEAQQKATADAEAEKTAQEEQIKSTIRTGIETGAEKLMADVQADMAKASADQLAEVAAKYEADLKEKSEELDAMRNSKKSFSDRSGSAKDSISKWGKDFMHAHLLGVMTGKGVDTKYSRDLMEKAGLDYATNAGGIAQEVSSQIEREINLELKLAQAFREITINSSTQVLPILGDSGLAKFGVNAVSGGNLDNNPQVTDNQFNAKQVILKATRLVSSTFMDNNIDEETLVNLMPMLIEGVARAHARSVDNAILNGTAGGDEGFNGLEALAGSNTVVARDENASGGTDLVLTAAEFLAARQKMGKYGMVAGDVAYVVNQSGYYDLIADSGFADITDVGSDLATKITGQVGAIYGSPVIVSDQLEANADGATAGYAVNVKNHVIPRLRGVSVEQDYEVMNQRNVIVASQSLGFNQLVANNGTTDVSVVKLIRTDVNS